MAYNWQIEELTVKRESRSYEGTEYGEFWRGAAKDYEDRVERAIVSHSLKGGRSIADIGAGYGRLANCYVGKYHSVVLVEPATNLRRMAEEKFGDAVRCVDGDVYRLPFEENTFDAVLMIRVMHHLTDPASALHELSRVVRPGGIVVFNYSNKRNIFRMARWLLRKGLDPFGDKPEIYLKDLYGHHPRAVQNMLEQCGLDNCAEYASGIGEKIVQVAPWLSRLLPTSLLVGRLLGHLKVSPLQFVVCQKK